MPLRCQQLNFANEGRKLTQPRDTQRVVWLFQVFRVAWDPDVFNIHAFLHVGFHRTSHCFLVTVSMVTAADFLTQFPQIKTLLCMTPEPTLRHFLPTVGFFVIMINPECLCSFQQARPGSRVDLLDRTK